MDKEQKTRAANDRRDDDLGPPCGWKDRRRHTERRIPTVEEQTMTEEEWLSYFSPPTADETDVAQASEASADVLGKARL
jgi:hypothetical protein